MDYAEILTSIEGSELTNKSELVSAIKSLHNDHLNRRHALNKKLSKLAESIELLSTLSGVEPSGAGDEVAQIEAAISKVKELKAQTRSSTESGSEAEAKIAALTAEIEGLKSEAKKVQKERLLDQACESLGYNKTVFKRLAELYDLTVEPGEGESETVVAVAGEGSDRKKVALKEYVETSEDWKPFLSVLTSASSSPDNSSSPPSSSARSAPSSGSGFGSDRPTVPPNQSPRSSDKESPVKSYLKRRYTLPNVANKE